MNTVQESSDSALKISYFKLYSVHVLILTIIHSTITITHAAFLGTNAFFYGER
jgi:hypothetical protein